MTNWYCGSKILRKDEYEMRNNYNIVIFYIPLLGASAQYWTHNNNNQLKRDMALLTLFPEYGHRDKGRNTR